MIIGDLHVFCSGRRPVETDTILFIYSDTILAFPIAPQYLEPVTRRNAEIIQLCGGIDLVELSKGDAPDVARQNTSCVRRIYPVIDILRGSIRERNDHSIT